MKTYLEERIEWYDDNYRNGNALISDKQFDQLEKNLSRTNPNCCLLYTSPSPRDNRTSRMPSSA